MYPGRSFTPDGHLVGSIGEVVAAEALKLTLHSQSYPAHDAFNEAGNVQIKMIGRKASSVAMYAASVRLVVLRLVSTTEAEIIYDGPGGTAWDAAGPIGKNGQRVIRLSRLAKLASGAPEFVEENGGGAGVERGTGVPV